MTKSRVQGAELSERNSNYVVAHPGTTAADILQLADKVVVRGEGTDRRETSSANCTCGEPVKKPPKKPIPTSRWGRRMAAVVMTLGVVAGLAWGIQWLGDSARRGIGERDRYAVRFADVECDAPPGLTQRHFFSEVRFLSGFPATFQSIDPDLKSKLTAAFAKHPWVAAVEDLSVEAAGSIRIRLKFRMPAIVIQLEKGGTRLLDGTGVLLPAGADPTGVPRLETPVPPQPVGNGSHWPDPTVERALEIVGIHHPQSLRKTERGWELAMGDGRTLKVDPLRFRNAGS